MSGIGLLSVTGANEWLLIEWNEAHPPKAFHARTSGEAASHTEPAAGRDSVAATEHRNL
jgi:hypothetical protein